MKNMLLLLLTLTLTPAWAAETAQPAEPQPAATTQTAPGTAAPATPDGTTAACTKTCVVMNCPPPNGTMKLCCPVAPYTQTCP